MRNGDLKNGPENLPSSNLEKKLHSFVESKQLPLDNRLFYNTAHNVEFKKKNPMI